ncbi:ESPR-type extended signal peptide-containing protein, partial [Haemophilus haemolyticus]|uniref:ESPR-type extended signal peptide-containing protein n=1 Tax=Haemophilus haemolyticus TaxID=726 RepID=UPI000518BEA9
MNKIFKIIWNATTQTWVVVSELTRAHTKRASATVATAVLATALSATAQASGTESEYDPNVFDPNNPNSTDEAVVSDTYRFGLAVLDENGEIKDDKLKNKDFATDDEKTKYTISVEDTQSDNDLPKYSSSFLYLKENGGIELEQNGRLAKFKVKTGDGLKIDKENKLTADTIGLTVNNGKVGDVNDNGSKLVNAGNLAKTLNDLGWRLKAGTNTSTVKSGEEVEFKGEGVTVKTENTNGKHIVTITAAQTQGGGTTAGGSWKAVAGKDGTGEVEPASPTAEEISAGDTVTFKAGDNLKIKQTDKNFTYSLKDSLTGLKDITLNKASDGSTNGASTKITNDGLTITPANAGTNTANTISVTKDGIKAGGKEITNVKSGLKTYGNNQNAGQPQTQPAAGSVEAAKSDLVKLDDVANTAGGTTANNGLANKAATVGDLAGLGWVLSADKTTKDDNSGVNDTAFHAAVKNANEVEFKGKGATVSAKTDSNGKYTVTVDVAETQVGNGLEKTDNTIKLKVKNKAGEDNLLTVDNEGVSVTKGSFADVDTVAPTAGQTNANRGKVVVKASDTTANAAPTEADKKKVATVVDVAKAINDAATFVKAENTDDEIDGKPTDDGQNDALKAGDTLTLKAGKNLKVKREGKDVTFALAKDLDVKTAKVSDKLSIGQDPNKVDVTSDAKGLHFAKGTNGDTTVHLNGIASTLQDSLSNTGAVSKLDGNGIDDEEKKRAASVKDVLSAGWNIRGAKTVGGAVDNVDFVATYDTVDFVSKDNDTTSVTVESQENGKRTEVKIGAKTSVIKEKDGKLFTGKDNKDTNQVDGSVTDNADEGKGLVTAKTVIEAVNKAGWRIKTTATPAAGKDGFETVTSGTNVTFADGKGATAEVAKATDGSITVKYNANVGDGLKIGNDQKITADTTALTVTGGKVAEITKDDDKKKLVNAGDLATALGSLSWKATAGKDTDGELDGAATDQEVKAGDKVTFKAGKNLKVKQDGANFTYSLKDALTGLTSITLDKAANGGTADATTKITNDGLTITPAAGAGTNDANIISVTKDGIKAGNKEITNVASALKTYKDAQNGGAQPVAGSVEEAKQNLVKLDDVTTPAAGGTTTNNDLAKKAATVGDLAGLGWVLSADKTTKADDTGVENNAFHAAVKNANEVEFKGKGSATVSAKTDNGKHVVTVNVKETELGDGLEKDNDGKIKVKASKDANNLLTVTADGASVTKGEFNTVDTTTPAAQGGNTNANDRGKVTVKASNGGQATADDKKKVATVGDVADAINSASTFVKVQSTNDDIEDSAASENETTDEALKAGDTLTLKAGKNLKVKREGKEVTFALAKDLDVKTATVSEKLSIGSGNKQVNVTSTADGLNFANATAVNGDTKVHLNNIGSSLTDPRLGGNTAHVTLDDTVRNQISNRAASVADVLSVGWNIKGAKSSGGAVENVDLVAGYDNVEFVTGNKDTFDVVLTAKDSNKTTEVKFTPKTSVIKEKDGKLFTGKDNKEKNQATNANPATDDTDAGKGLVTAKEVIEAVNKAGWRIKTTQGANAQAGQFETVASGTNVTFADGNGATAEVTKGTDGAITVKYNAKVGDGLKLDGDKIAANTTALTVEKGKVTAPDANNGDGKKLVNAEGLATALNKLSWTATAGKDANGELDGEAKDQEVKAGDKVTFKAGDNLKVKQEGANFTYSLKDSLTGLKDITLNKASDGSTNGATTKITNEGLTITPNGAGADTANTISVTKDGIKAGNQVIANVKSALTTYGATPNGAGTQPAGGNTNTAKNSLINLDAVTTPATGGTTTDNALASKAATVGDLAGLGWVLSSDKTTKADGTGVEDNKEFHAAVKNANEVEFKGKGAATVSAKSENGGKYVVTVDVAKTKVGDGLEENDGTIKVKAKEGADNLLTVTNEGASVTKGEFNKVETTTPAAQGG